MYSTNVYGFHEIDREAAIRILNQEENFLHFNIGDFCRLHRDYLVKEKTHTGIILAPQQQYSIGQQLTGLLKLVAALSNVAASELRQESFLKAYPEFALPTRFSELDINLKIPDRILDLALEKLVLVDLPGNVEEAFNHWLRSSDILEAAIDLGVEIQNWYLLDDSTECYEGFLRTWELLQDNVSHVLVRNLGRCEEWESFEQL